MSGYATATKVESFPAEVTDRLIQGSDPIRVFRQYRGITAADLAKAVGVMPATISMIEVGKRRGSVDRIQAIARVLRVTVNNLVN